jgi:hypothetical protein
LLRFRPSGLALLLRFWDAWARRFLLSTSTQSRKNISN